MSIVIEIDRILRWRVLVVKNQLLAQSAEGSSTGSGENVQKLGEITQFQSGRR